MSPAGARPAAPRRCRGPGRPGSAALLLWAAASACEARAPAAVDAPGGVAQVGAAASTASAPPSPSLDGGGPVRWIVVGGGGAPDSNQVSIEQDVALAASVLGPGGLTFYAGGPGTGAVQVQTQQAQGDPLLAELGELFAPRGGRSSTYRETRLRVQGAARAAGLRAALERVLSDGRAPLLLYLAGHGEMGESARDTVANLWGGDRLSPADLAEWLEAEDERGRPRGQRPVRLVATTCFSGGFAELAFAGADPARGPPAVVRCGLFATTDDLPASGCDPNPDRAAQEGYGLHFLNALAGRDRAGKPLGPEAIDFDGDGRVSLLEAHTRVRIASRGGEVPTTTSERWLREVLQPGAAEEAEEEEEAPEASREAPREARGTDAAARAPVALPEEDAVIAALGRSTGQGANLGRVSSELDLLETRVAEAKDELTAAEAAEDRTFRDVAAEMLSRWPVLDDPWHPLFAPTLARERGPIEAYLHGSPVYAAYRKAAADADRADAALWDLRLRAAPLERLERALETEDLAARLNARGGEAWETYRELLACERTLP